MLTANFLNKEELLALPKLDYRTFLTLSEEIPDEDTARQIKLIENYFAGFCPISTEENIGFPCPACGVYLGGLFGSFKYGIQHGWGFCGTCLWPCVMHHYLKDEDGSQLLSLTNFLLALHPSKVDIDKWLAKNDLNDLT
jgi:hypothetical protein